MRDLLYIRELSSTEGSFVTICGLTFPEFVNGVERPLNILVLRSLFPDSISFHEINFDGIRDNLEDPRFNDLEKLLGNPKWLDGDFFWIDYRDERQLIEIPDDQLAELCFLAQQSRPLNSPFVGNLENRFVYFGHDDGFHTSLYVRHPQDLLRLLHSTIQQKARCLGFQVTDIDDFPRHFQDGIVIDFNAISESGLPVWFFDGPFSFDTFNRSDLANSKIAVTLATERTNGANKHMESNG